MKIAAVAENENSISQHFGRAPLYMVLTVKGNKIVDREKRVRAGHDKSACEGEPKHSEYVNKGHGYDTDSQRKHTSMAEAIADCNVVIAGGMGRGAYDSLKSCNIKPVITNVRAIDEAVKLYIEGNLPNLMEKLH